MPGTSLQRDVMTALAGNPIVDAAEIAAQVRDGVVILRGTVGTPLQRAEAVRATHGVPGVRTVDDRLVVRPLGIDGHHDADTEAAVLAALIAHDGPSAEGIEVGVKDGIVTLRGALEHAAERDAADQVVRRVPGVASVRNELAVIPAASGDDIAARVNEAVDFAAFEAGERVAVRVHDHEVTLTGTIHSLAEQQAAIEAAATADGVLRVHDELTLEKRV